MCSTCAEIPYDFHCERCNVEAGHHRGRLCVRCVLRDDLQRLLGRAPSDPSLAQLVDVLCAAERPESIITWKRSPIVQQLLQGLGDGTIPATHEGLDGPRETHPEHLRALMQHHDLPPHTTPTYAGSNGGSTRSSMGLAPRQPSPSGNSPPGTTSDESEPCQQPAPPPEAPSTQPNRKSPKP